MEPKKTPVLVRVKHDYEYVNNQDHQPVVIKVGEEYHLIGKTSPNWWYVKKDLTDAVGLYVPALYVQELQGSSPQPRSKAPLTVPTPAGSVQRRQNAVRRPKSSDTKDSKESSVPSLSVSAIEELGDIMTSLNVPEEFQDSDASPKSPELQDEVILEQDEIIQRMKSSPIPPATKTEKQSSLVEESTTPTKCDLEGKMDSDKPTASEGKVESETSDYKTDSRESLDVDEAKEMEVIDRNDAEVTSFSGWSEPNTGGDYANYTNIRAGQPLDQKDGIDQQKSKDSSMEDYANLEDIQKAIREHQRAKELQSKSPPLAENLLPSNYGKPNQNQQQTLPKMAFKNKLHSTNSVEGNLMPSTTRPERGQSLNQAPLDDELTDLSPAHHLQGSVPESPAQQVKRWSFFSRKKKKDEGLGGSVHLMKFAHTPSTPPCPSTGQPSANPLASSVTLPPPPSSSSSGIEDTSPSPSTGKPSAMALEPKMVEKQGLLQKAKIEENSKKMKKSWSQSFVVLCQNLLYFYKDMKPSAAAKPRSIASLGKPEFIVDLKGSKVSSAPEDKNSKKDAFMLLTTMKIHYLLFHDNNENNNHWRQSIENNIAVLESGVVPDVVPQFSKDKTATLKHAESTMTLNGMESKQTIANRLKNFLLRRPTKESIKLKGIYKEVTFGSSLVSICEREKDKVPRFVKECILAVEARGLTMDGLYRVSGNMSSVQKLRSMVDLNEFYDLNQPIWDVHTITGTLKLFFRELSEPLFTFKLFRPFVSSINNLSAVKELVEQLPEPHAKTMKALFKHFTAVLQHSRENRMQVQGLAIVFGPTLLWPENKAKDANLALDLVQQGQLVEFIINNCKAIFK